MTSTTTPAGPAPVPRPGAPRAGSPPDLAPRGGAPRTDAARGEDLRPRFLTGMASVLVSGLLSITWLWISLTVLITGIASLPAVLTGLLLLVPWVLAMRVAASFERRRARAVHGVDVVHPARRVSRGTGFGAALQNLGLDLISWQFWRSVLHHHLTMLVGFFPSAVLYSGLWGAWTGAELAITAPGAQLGPWHPGALVLALGAVASLAIGVGALAAGVLAERGLARVMLPSSDDGLREEVHELSMRRQGAVDAAEQERLRIERDLHDGVQPRLVALAMTLGMARSRIENDPVGAAELVDEAHDEAKAVITDLRQLARGIHPAVLTDRGLDPALSALAARSPVPVDLSVTAPERLGREQEAVAYFVVSEALTNVAKHAAASHVRVEVSVAGPTTRPGVPGADRRLPGSPAHAALRVRIEDDGRGGARVRRDGVSTGLAGLTDRVRATGGQLVVSSPAGGPTVLDATIPVPTDPSGPSGPSDAPSAPTAPTGTAFPPAPAPTAADSDPRSQSDSAKETRR
ncbi:sensor histidine kinase [Brachybacterium subflavum]|uniref:sensor histidine kinase n=1 Tax=Brachybacterium subflavum TaxID=2585206 RepID=UPI001D0D62F8|nr:histidine kinase [Brachybacterium subflavum]